MKFTLVLLLGGSVATGADALRPILEAHRWFDLRDAVRAGKAPALYRGIVAAAFNDFGCAEKELRAAIRSGAGRDDQSAAHEALSNLYYRNGFYRRAAAEVRLKWALTPEEAPSEAEKVLVTAFERLPDPVVVSRASASVSYTTWHGGEIVTPLVINGQTARFMLDTGSEMSVISEAEAKRLGMRIVASEIQFHGASGSAASGAQMAVADQLTVGKTELRNVTFLVLRDDQEPFADYPLGERGAVGLPVMLTVQTLRWNGEHTLDLGFKAGHANRHSANLCFEGAGPLVEVEVGTRRLAFILDTGGEHSELWPVFGREFAALFRGAKKATKDEIGISGAANVDVAILPDLRMMLASFPIVFHDAPVLLAPTVGPSKWHYGMIGIDLLKQAEEVTLDFRGMRILLK